MSQGSRKEHWGRISQAAQWAPNQNSVRCAYRGASVLSAKAIHAAFALQHQCASSGSRRPWTQRLVRSSSQGMALTIALHTALLLSLLRMFAVLVRKSNQVLTVCLLSTAGTADKVALQHMFNDAIFRGVRTRLPLSQSQRQDWELHESPRNLAHENSSQRATWGLVIFVSCHQRKGVHLIYALHAYLLHIRAK